MDKNAEKKHVRKRRLWRVYGNIPGIGYIDRKTQAYSAKQALLQTAEYVKNKFFRKRGLPEPDQLYLRDLNLEDLGPLPQKEKGRDR